MSSQQKQLRDAIAQVKSIGSAEEESPRWSNPPEPESKTQQILPSLQSQISDATNTAGNSFENNRFTTQSCQRHVFSQPFLNNDLTAIEQPRPSGMRTPNSGGMPLLYPGQSDTGRTYGQTSGTLQNAVLSSPILSGQEKKSTPDGGSRGRIVPVRVTQLMQSFAERLVTRETVAQIKHEVEQSEALLMSMVAREAPSIHEQLLREKTEMQIRLQRELRSQMGAQGLNHFALMKQALAEANHLRQALYRFKNIRSEYQGIDQIVEGIQLDMSDCALERESSSGHVLQKQMSASSLQQRPINVNEKESTINHIKSGSLPSSGRQGTISSARQDYNSNENFMLNLIQKQETELANCNALVDRLKSECADLELTVVDQRSEIQNLCNKLKQASRSESPSFDKRELDSLVMRLKEELRLGAEREELTKEHLRESASVIKNMQDQISLLKHKLVMADETSRNHIHSTEVQDRLRDAETIRRDHAELLSRYDSLALSVQEKDRELAEKEEKAQEMLVAAQQDAQEVIQYFKSLAFGKQPAKEPRPSSHSPNTRSVHSQKATVHTGSQHANVRRSFPASLAPVPKERRQAAFKQAEDHILINGVQLRLQNQNRTLEANARRNQTLSSSPTTHKQRGPRSQKTRTQQESDGEEDVLGMTIPVKHPELKLEVAISSMVSAFEEIAEAKKGIMNLVEGYGDQYCQQLQKFSVLAYDYLDQIDSISVRDKKIEEELQAQESQIKELKQLTVRQFEHIKAQSALIAHHRSHLAAVVQAKDRQVARRDEEARGLGQSLLSEIPQLEHSLNSSLQAIIRNFDAIKEDKRELHETNQLLDLAKTKNRLLEEELEKALQSNETMTEQAETTKKKFDQVVDLIKDIWQEEVRQGQQPQQPPLCSDNRRASTLGMGSQRGTANDLSMTLTSNMLAAAENPKVDSIPMPVSWLGEISTHIKQLKEMNDFQTDEVFQIVNMLHAGKAGRKGPASRLATGGAESGSTEEDERSELDASGGFHHSESLARAHLMEPPEEEAKVRADAEDSQDQIGLEHYEQEAQRRHGQSVALRMEESTRRTKPIFDAEDELHSVSEVSSGKRKRRFGFFGEVHGDRSRQPGHTIDGGLQRSVTELRERAQGQPSDARARDRSHPSRLQTETWRNPYGKQRSLHARSRSPHVRETILSDFAQHQRTSSSRQRLAGVQRPTMRASLDMTGTLLSAGQPQADKRNELYTMLREEVFDSLRQARVSRDTVLSMKAEMRRLHSTIQALQQEHGALTEAKAEADELAAQLGADVKDREAQAEQLQQEVADREAQMESLKMQIEDFERELGGLQDQMSHVMKLNAEIGQASEHWERSFHRLKDEAIKDKLQLKANFKRQLAAEGAKIQQFKRKLAEKETALGKLRGELEQSRAYIEDNETRRSAMVARPVQTDPAFELLQSENRQLTNQLSLVKRDVSAVLDQVEKEQVANGKLDADLRRQREVATDREAETQQARQEVARLTRQLQEGERRVAALQSENEAQLAEIRQMTEAMEQDQQYFNEQMENADRVNAELQAQVDNVTQVAEDLQDQVALHTEAVASDQRVPRLEQEVARLREKVRDQSTTIFALEAKQLAKRKRETRSMSNSRNETGRLDTYTEWRPGDPSKPLATKSQRAQELPRRRGKQTSASRASSLAQQHLDQLGACTVKDSGLHTQQEQTLQTSQSILEENLAAHREGKLPSALYPHSQSSRKLAALAWNRGSNNTRLQQRSGQRHPERPPRQGSQRKSVSPESPSHPKNQRNQRGPSQLADTSMNLDASPMTGALGKTHAGISTQTGAAQGLTCCCGSVNCLNWSAQQLPGRTSAATAHGASKMNAIDDLQSSYKQFKFKQEAVQRAERKVERVLTMTEHLVSHFLTAAQTQLQSRLTYGSQGTIKSKSGESTMNELRRHVSDWSAHYWIETKPISDQQATEAKAFFKKRNPKVLTYLEKLADSFNPGENTFGVSSAQKEAVLYSFQKEPPTIVSHRVHEQTDSEATESSEKKLLFDQQPSTNQTLGAQSVNLVFSRQDPGSRLPSGLHTQQVDPAYLKATGHSSATDSSCAQCSAAFQQSHAAQSEARVHWRALMQKYLHTGRSLAGLCYGGCVMMGEQFDADKRASVDASLQFLSRDASQFEATHGHRLEELSRVTDGLLSVLSQIVTASAQSQIKAIRTVAGADKKAQTQNLESIELSMDYLTHQVSGVDKTLFNASCEQTGGLLASSQVAKKLLEVEQRIKSKFHAIAGLEALVDQSIAHEDSRALLGKVKRHLSKLKIELHQDYLLLCQVNLHSQPSKDCVSSSSATTFDLQPNQPAATQSLTGPHMSSLHSAGQTAPAAGTSFNGYINTSTGQTQQVSLMSANLSQSSQKVLPSAFTMHAPSPYPGFANGAGAFTARPNF